MIWYFVIKCLNDCRFILQFEIKKRDIMNAICGETILRVSEFNWIDKKDREFTRLFQDSIDYVESKQHIKHSFFNSISKQPSSKDSIEEFAQYYTPADVALYTAYQLLKDFDIKNQVVFDPCAGKGSLLIAIGAVLAIKYNLRNEDLLYKLYGTEICHETYIETIDNIVDGLSSWIGEVSLEEAKKILLKNIKHNDFLNEKIPDNCFLIVNPPYKEVKGVGNLWLNFGKKITEDKNVKSFAMIVPISVCSADRTLDIRKNILKNYNEIIALHHDTRPRPLFKNIEQRISIIVAHKNKNKNIYSTTGFIGHSAGNRISVWKNEYANLEYKYCENVFPKLKEEEVAFLKKHFEPCLTLSNFLVGEDLVSLWVRTTGRYNLQAQYEEPSEITSKWRNINISKKGAEIILSDFQNGAVLKWWKIFGDGRDLSMKKFLANYGVSDV